MTLYPLVKFPAQGKSAVLDWTDLESLTCSKARGQAAGSWSLTVNPRHRAFVGNLIDNDLVEIYRYTPNRPGDPELLMTGLVGQVSAGGWTKDANGGRNYSLSLNGQDFGKPFITNQQYHAPYMGVLPKADLFEAFKGNPIFGASSYGEIEQYGDPGYIIDAIVQTFLLGESGSEHWGINFQILYLEPLSGLLDLSGVLRLNFPADRAVDPGIMWAYGLFDASGLYGSTWQALEKMVARDYQQLWIESAMVNGRAGARLRFEPLPFWSHDRPGAFIDAPALALNHDNLWNYQPSVDARERFNFYSCIPHMMLGGASLAYQYTNTKFDADYSGATGQKFQFAFPIRERGAADYGEQYHGLNRREATVESLAWGLAGVAAEKIRESMRLLNLRLWDFYFASHEMAKASATMRHEGPWPKINTYCDYEPDGLRYLIESSSTSWRRGDGFTDSMQLNRGIGVERFFELLKQRNANYIKESGQ